MAAAEAPQLPTTQKAVVYDKPGELSTKVEQIQVPEPGPGEVLVQITHSGVCHSDLSIMLNGWKWLPAPTAAGQVGGHEGVGKVVKLGPGAEASSVKIGDRVGIKWISGVCDSCPACLTGHESHCLNQKISGYFTPGTFQQYALGPANYVTPIPDGLDSADAAPFLCGGVTVYSALRKSEAKSGNWVLIVGAGGGLGHLAVQIAAKGMGMRVIGIDHSSKEKLVNESGAEHFLAVDKETDTVKKVQDLTDGLGVHAVIVLVGNQKAYAQAMDFLRFGGRLVCIGIPEGDLLPVQGAIPGVMCAKGLSIKGVAVGDRGDAMEVLDLAKRGVVKMHYTVDKPENLNTVFKDMEAGKLQGRVVLDMS